MVTPELALVEKSRDAWASRVKCWTTLLFIWGVVDLSFHVFALIDEFHPCVFIGIALDSCMVITALGGMKAAKKKDLASAKKHFYRITSFAILYVVLAIVAVVMADVWVIRMAHGAKGHHGGKGGRHGDEKHGKKEHRDRHGRNLHGGDCAEWR
jgi:hypothetical protein